MVEDFVREVGYWLTSSVENLGEEPDAEEWEPAREGGMKSVGRGNAAWIEAWEESTADFVSG
jgi:hypothetical protein